MRLRLVVVDDEVFVRKGILSSIQWEQYDIEISGEAPDGKSALELIRRTRPHIVLTDIRMPHMDGLEMIRIIRQELPETKIFILSVLDDFQSVREALRLGVVDYVPKLSMTPDDLLQTVLKAKEQIVAESAGGIEKEQAEQAPEAAPGNERVLEERMAGLPSEIARAIEYIRARYMLPIRLKEIARTVHLSENYFSYLFTKETGITFSYFLQEVRVEQAKRMLEEGKSNWIAIGEQAGFESPKYFTKVFKKFVGVTPKQYLRRRK